MTQRVELVPPKEPVPQLEALVKVEAGQVQIAFMQDGRPGICFMVTRQAARLLALTIFDALAEQGGT